MRFIPRHTRSRSARPRDIQRTESGAEQIESRRRGSALVVAIGSLALIALFAAVYVTIGQSDKRVSFSVERRLELESIEDDLARHILDTLKADRFDTYLEPIVAVDTTGQASFSQRLVREAFDAPYTDASVVSQLPMALQASQSGGTLSAAQLALIRRFSFTPSGRHTELFTDEDFLATNGLVNQPTELNDVRVPYDPWLASSEPWFAGLDVFERIYSRPNVSLPPVPEFFYLDNRDWPQITNIAPDGRFVNLFNLRDNFDAEPGFGDDGAGDPRMSAQLTLLEPLDIRDTADRLRLRATRTVPLDLYPATSGTAMPKIQSVQTRITLDDTVIDAFVDDNGLPNELTDLTLEMFPVWTTMRQRFMYFPSDPAFKIYTPSEPIAGVTANVPATPGTPYYADYQYADTDGDGMFDARWFELVRAFDPGNPVYLGAEPGAYRWFMAARIVDLSSMVNVNTATDQLAAPTTTAPAGMTPAEIDLRRLLSMEDIATAYTSMSEQNIQPSYNNGISPANNDESIYRGQRLSFRYIEQPRVGDGAFISETVRPGTNASYLVYDVQTGSRYGVDSEYLMDAALVGLQPGRFGYDAIRRSIESPRLSLTPDTNQDVDTRLVEQVGIPYEYYDPILDPDVLLSDRSPFLTRLATFGNQFQGYPLYTRSRARVAGPGFPNAYLFHDSAVGGQLRPDGPSFARARYYEEIGRVDPSIPQSKVEFAKSFGAEVFGVDDLSELLTYWSINDDRTTSRLERVVGGRFANEIESDLAAYAGERFNTVAFSPLRSNRPTALERFTADNTTGYPEPEAGNFFTARGVGDDVIDNERMALLALDPRHRITTYSAASPIRRTALTGDLRALGDTASPDIARFRSAANARLRALTRERIVGDASVTDDPDERDRLFMDAGNVAGDDRGLRSEDFMLADWDAEARIGVAGVDLDPLRDPFSVPGFGGGTALVNETNDPLGQFISNNSDTSDNGILGSVTNLFRYYADALLPHSGMARGIGWQPDDRPGNLLDDRLATLSYGYRGPELAIRLAAHLAVNAVDAYDDRPYDQPTVVTLLIDGRVQGEADGASGSTLPPTRELMPYVDPTNPAVVVSNTPTRDNPYWGGWVDRSFNALVSGVGGSAPIPIELPGVRDDLNTVDPTAHQELERLLNDERYLETALETRRTRLDLDELTGAIEYDRTLTTGATRLRDTDNDNLVTDELDTRRLAQDVQEGNGGLQTLGSAGGTGILVPPSRRAVNVIGIEKQPFLAEVAAMMIYSDTERASLGVGPSLLNNGNIPNIDPADAVNIEDGETAFIPVGVANDASDDFPSRPTGLVTIDPTFENYDVNPDLLLQVVAFQLHNPFDEPILLRGDANEYDYVIEFLGRFFPLVPYEGGTALTSTRTPGSEIVIPAGGSRVFYVTAHDDLPALSSHWEDAAAASGGGGLAQTVEQFLIQQFTVTDPSSVNPILPQEPVRLGWFDPETMQQPAHWTDFYNLLEYDDQNTIRPNPTTDTENDRWEVRLWRRYTYEGPDGASLAAFQEPEEASPANPYWLGNDILADRLRIPDDYDMGEDGANGNVLRAVDMDYALNIEGSITAMTANTVDGAAYPTGYQGLLATWLADFPGAPTIAQIRDLHARLISFSDASVGEDQGLTMVRWGSVRRPDLGKPVDMTTGLDPRDFNGDGFTDNLNLVNESGTAILPIAVQVRNHGAAGQPFSDETWVFPERAPLGSFPALAMERQRFAAEAPELDETMNLALFGHYFDTDLDAFSNTVNVMAQLTLTDAVQTWAASEPIIATLTFPGGQKHRAAELTDTDVVGVPDDNGNPINKFLQVGTPTRDRLSNDRPGDPNYLASETATQRFSDDDFLIDVLPQLFTSARRHETRGRVRAPFGIAVLNPTTGALISEGEDPVSTFRLTDLLNVLAVGPVHLPWRDADPSFPALAAANNVANGEYVTLAEAMTYALGFANTSAYAEHFVNSDTDGDQVGDRDRTDAGVRSGVNYTVYSELFTPSIDRMFGTPSEYTLDRGQLRLDTAAFFDFAGDGTLANLPGQQSRAREYEPELGDFRVGSGATFAGDLLNIGRVHGVGRLDAADDRLNRPQIGKVNINTAPLPVLRVLPGLTPPLYRSYGDESLGWGLADDWSVRETFWDGVAGQLPAMVAFTPDDNFDTVAFRWEAYNAFGLPNPFVFARNENERDDIWQRNPDRAAMIAAYRDRGVPEFRTVSRPTGSDTALVREDRELTVGRYTALDSDLGGAVNPQLRLIARNYKHHAVTAGGMNVENLADHGRTLITGIRAGREQPGFETIGEVASVTVSRGRSAGSPFLTGNGDPMNHRNGLVPDYLHDADTTNPGGSRLSLNDRERWRGPVTSPFPLLDDADEQLGVHSLDANGFTMATPAAGGVAPVGLGSRQVFDDLMPTTIADDERVAMTVDPSVIRREFIPTTGLPGARDFEPPVADEMANEYDEKLSTLASLVNSIDVRSDTYAAWFVVRGYRESDVQGLSGDQLMLPSVERRFLMVIDRSNVVSENDEPRVLLFKRLPE